MTTHLRWNLILSILVSFGLLAVSCGDDEPDVTATFTSPASGASIAGAVVFTLAADGVTIEPSGEVNEGAGHFHVIADAGCVATGEAIPKDIDHVHLGSGAAEGTIYLGPGNHELCVQVADGAHTATDVTSTISVDVGVTDRAGWCAVAEELDNMLNDTTDDDDFATQRSEMERVARMVAQLAAGLEQVDADERDNVSAVLDFVELFAAAVVEADTFEEAEANAESLWELDEDPTAAAQPWILEACGVDINDDGDGS